MTSADPAPETTVPQTTVPEPTLPQTNLRAMTWRDIPTLVWLELDLFAADAWLDRTWSAGLTGRRRAPSAPRPPPGPAPG
mgnify:CR=1 FL=1